MFFIKTRSTIESSLTKQEVVQRLWEITNTNDLFVGQIGDSEFRIHKRPKENVRNAFSPVLIGKIEDNNNSCNISITARLNTFVSIFFLIWSIGAIIIPIIVALVEPLALLGALVFATLLMLLIYFAFYKPAKKAIALLSSLLRK